MSYYTDHKEQVKASMQRWYEKQGFKNAAEYQRALRFKRRGEPRTPKYQVPAERQREMRQKLRRDVLFLLGDKCIRCGFSDPRALQIDHINGGGRQDRKKDGMNLGYYKRIIVGKGVGYQLLCANCNWIKRYENNEHN
jgi:hypothetical protein